MMLNRLIIRTLMVLGFGGAVGLLGSCSASRASRSRNADPAPVADSVVVRDGDAPVQVMYGVPPARFDPDRQARRLAHVLDTNVVRGRVTDEKGEPLRGATVSLLPQVKEYAVVDEKGEYAILADTGDSLRIDFLGYLSQTVKVKGRKLDIRMEADTAALNRVIMVMYGVRPTPFDANKTTRKTDREAFNSSVTPPLQK